MDPEGVVEMGSCSNPDSHGDGHLRSHGPYREIVCPDSPSRPQDVSTYSDTDFPDSLMTYDSGTITEATARLPNEHDNDLPPIPIAPENVQVIQEEDDDYFVKHAQRVDME